MGAVNMSDAQKRVKAFIGADRRIDIPERLAARAEDLPSVTDLWLITGKQLEIEKSDKDGVIEKEKDVKDSKEEKDKEIEKETGKDDKDHKDDEKDTKDNDKETVDKPDDKEVSKDKENKEDKDDKEEKDGKEDKEGKDDKEGQKDSAEKPEDFDKEGPHEVLPPDISLLQLGSIIDSGLSTASWSRRPNELLKRPPVV